MPQGQEVGDDVCRLLVEALLDEVGNLCEADQGVGLLPVDVVEDGGLGRGRVEDEVLLG